ncbi:caspase family protein [Bacteroidota bacterium]
MHFSIKINLKQVFLIILILISISKISLAQVESSIVIENLNTITSGEDPMQIEYSYDGNYIIIALISRIITYDINKKKVITEFPYVRSSDMVFYQNGKKMFYHHPEKHQITYMYENSLVKIPKENSSYELRNSLRTIDYLSGETISEYNFKASRYWMPTREDDENNFVPQNYFFARNKDHFVLYFKDSLMLYNPENKEMVFQEGFNEDAVSIALFSDNRILVAMDDSLALINPLEAGKTQYFITDSIENVFIPNDDLIISMFSGKATSWEIKENKLKKVSEEYLESGITSFTSNFNGEIITYNYHNFGFGITKKKNLYLFDNKFNKIGELLLEGGNSTVGTFHPVRNALLLQTKENKLELFDLESYLDKAAFVPQIGHKEAIRSIDISFDKKYMVTSSNDKIVIWDMKLGKCLFTFTTSLEDYAYFKADSYDIIMYSGDIYEHFGDPILIRWKDWIHNYENTLHLKDKSEVIPDKYIQECPVAKYKKWANELKDHDLMYPYQIDKSEGWKVAVVLDISAYKKKLIIKGIGKNKGLDLELFSNDSITYQDVVHIIDDNSIVAAGNNDIYIIDPHSGKIKRSIQLSNDKETEGIYFNGLSRLAFSDSNNILFSYYNDNLVSVWNIKEGTLLENITNNNAQIGNDRRFDFSHPYLSNCMISNDLLIQTVINMNTGKEAYGLGFGLYDTIINYKDFSFQFLNNKNSFIDAVKLRPESNELVILAPVFKHTFDYAFENKIWENPIVSCNLFIWDFKKLKIVRSMNIPAPITVSCLDVSSDGKQALVWNLNSVSNRMIEENISMMMDNEVNIDKFFLINLESEQIKEYSLSKLDINRIATYGLKFIKDDPEKFYVRDDFNSMLYFFNIKNRNYSGWMNGMPADYGVEDSKERGTVLKPYTISDDGENVFFAKGNGIFAHQNSYTGINKKDNTTIFEIFTKHQIYSSAYNSQKNWLALGFYENIIQLIDVESGQQIGQLINEGNNGFFLTPDGYYRGSRTGIKEAYFRYKDELFPFEQFDLKYNRPDIILERLGSADDAIIDSYYKAYQKRLKQIGFTEDMLSSDFHIPELQIQDLASMPVQTNKESLNLRINTSDSKYEIDRIYAWVNNIPIYGIKGYPTRDSRKQDLNLEFDIPLSKGLNKVQFSCLNSKGTESLKETFTINYEPQSKKSKSLHIVVISVSDYQDDRMDLKYAAKDGRDLVNLYTEANSGDWDNIIFDTLLNQNAKRENILAIKEKLKHTSIEDQVILYVSGHGLLDNDFDFYFATHDIDFNNPAERGISYEELEWLLDSIPARNKLFLMDACHSGEVDKEELIAYNAEKVDTLKSGVKRYTYKAGILQDEEVSGLGLQNSFELMQELFSNLNRGSGAVVISAAAGDSYAMESDEWENGVFTYSILNGLKSGDADSNKDGEITVSELRDYVSKSVQELTNGLQKPTMRQENIEFDFRVW